MPRTHSSIHPVTNWIIEILSRESTLSAPRWLKINGLDTIDTSSESDTTDTAPSDALWAEPLITKRSAKFKLKGRRIYVGSDGSLDPGQAELDYRALLSGYDADTTLRLTAPVGTTIIVDAIITDVSQDIDPKGQIVTWSLEQVGAPDHQLYVQLQAMSILKNATPVTAVTVTQNNSVHLTVSLTPENASNKNISVLSADSTSVAVLNHDGLSFDLHGLKRTTSPVRVVVRAMNNDITKELQVTVE